jgi:hypothetical protein
MVTLPCTQPSPSGLREESDHEVVAVGEACVARDSGQPLVAEVDSSMRWKPPTPGPVATGNELCQQSMGAWSRHPQSSLR